MDREEDGSCLWHKRLGHLNFNYLTMLFQKNMVFRLQIIEKKHRVCEGCLLGKHHLQPFPKEGTRRAKEVLQFVHTNACGPMNILSHA